MSRANRSALLLVLLTAMSCSSSPSPAAVDAASNGYVLRVDGDSVSLSFTRELTVPEFLQLAQEVTNCRYVYDRDQVAKSGLVTFLGRVQCPRSEFPSFVSTMLYIRGLSAEARGAGDERYIEVLPMPGPNGARV